VHPNTFIEQLWRGVEADRVFVAMSFAPQYDARFRDVFRPAIEAVRYRGRQLTASRVDESQTGDSIVTEIVRGICESRLVLADVSDLTGESGAVEPVRNGNVMYELGLAHAVKSPGKVLIVRDDSNRLLFDLSSIPHFIVDFTAVESARARVTGLLNDRLREFETIDDMKLRTFIDSISDTELSVLVLLFNSGETDPVDLTITSGSNKVLPLAHRDAIHNLRDAGLVRSHIAQNPVVVLYSLTERGQRAFHTLARVLKDAKSKT
jgi:hypothetical protein